MNNCRIVVLGKECQWLDYSIHDLNQIPNTEYFGNPLPTKNCIMNILSRIQFSERIGKYIKMPLNSVWYKYFAWNICKDNKTKLVLIIYDRNRLGNDSAFLDYLKKRFENIKLVYVFTDLVSVSGAKHKNFVNKLSEYYDIVYAFEDADAKQYGFKSSQLLYSKNSVSHRKPSRTVFYAGNAKDRLNELIRSYEKFSELGIDTNYYILGVDEKQQKYSDKIHYNKKIPYSEVIRHTQNAGIIIDIPQKNQRAFSIKFCEAIYYDKILLTTDDKILNAPFYDSEYMYYIQDMSEISLSMFRNCNKFSYTKDTKDYFSVNRFINMVIHDLGVDI